MHNNKYIKFTILDYIKYNNVNILIIFYFILNFNFLFCLFFRHV